MSEPKIVAFLCNWCTYTGADMAGTARLKVPTSIRVIRVMCSSRVDPVMVLKAFREGADGVFIGGCHPGDCHYQRGNYFTRRRMAMLKSMLTSLGLEPERLRLSWVSASEGPRFSKVTQAFADKIAAMGPARLVDVRPRKAAAGAAAGGE